MGWLDERIIQFNIDGSFVRRIDNIVKSELFGDENGRFNKYGVARCVDNKGKSYRGYIFIKESEYTPELLSKRIDAIKNRWGCLNKPVLRLDSSGEIIQRYDSIKDASEKHNLVYGNLVNHLRRRKSFDTCMGYFWEYEENYLKGEKLNEKKFDIRIKKDMSGLEH